jgi:hypothetical protein
MVANKACHVLRDRPISGDESEVSSMVEVGSLNGWIQTWTGV